MKNPFKRKTKFLPQYLDILRQIKEGKILTKQGNAFSATTIHNYHTTADRVKKYERDTGTIYIEDMNIDWAEKFVLYLMSKGYSKNTISSTISAVKTNLRRLFRRGISTQTGDGFPAAGELTTAVYSSIEDIRALLDCDLDFLSGQSRVRHIYVLHCFLGFRVKDLLKFLKNPKTYIRDIGGKTFVEMKTEKTGEVVVIPLAKIALQILAIFDYDFGDSFTYQYYNRTIKEVARKAGLTQEIVVTRTQGGVRKDTVREKCDLMSSHTARRTFATNAFLAGLSEKSIMLITGHKSAHSFYKYIRCNSLDSAIKIAGHPFFDIELPITELLEEKDMQIIEDENQKKLS